MDKEHQLRYCKVCSNRQFDMQRGLLCSLTGEAATFQSTCPDFKRDEDEVVYYDRKREAAQAEADGYHPTDYKGNKTIGILLMVGAAVLLLSSLMIEGIGVIILPFGMGGTGAFFYVKGLEQEKKQEAELQRIKAKQEAAKSNPDT